jgi:hypothetical protein
MARFIDTVCASRCLTFIYTSEPWPFSLEPRTVQRYSLRVFLGAGQRTLGPGRGVTSGPYRDRRCAPRNGISVDWTPAAIAR